MPPTRNPTIQEVIRLLQRADHFNRLAKQCPAPHRRGFYRLKDLALAQALVTGPDQFVIDSVQSRTPLTLGLTHRPSGRQVHVRPYRLPGQVQLVLHALARSCGVHYAILRLSSCANPTIFSELSRNNTQEAAV